MRPNQSRRGTPRIVSDLYDEWADVDALAFARFGHWLDRQLTRLERRYADWETLGYAYWRNTHRLRAVERQTEAGAAE
jgi:hypothetical protein